MLHGLTMHTLELCSPRSPNYLQHHKLPTHRLEKTYAGGAPAARSAALHPARAPRLAGTLSSPPAAPPAPAAACGAWARVAPGLALSYTRSAPQPPLQMPPQPAGESARRCRPQQTSRAQASPLRQDHARPAARLAGAPSLRQPAAMIGGGAVLCLPRLRSRFLSAARPVRCQLQAAPRPWGCSRLRPRGDSAARWLRRPPPLRCARRRRRCPRRRLWTPRAGACAWQPRAPRQREQLAAQCTQAAPAQNTEWVSKRLWKLRILPQPPFPSNRYGLAGACQGMRACACDLLRPCHSAHAYSAARAPGLLHGTLCASGKRSCAAPDQGMRVRRRCLALRLRRRRAARLRHARWAQHCHSKCARAGVADPVTRQSLPGAEPAGQRSAVLFSHARTPAPATCTIQPALGEHMRLYRNMPGGESIVKD